MDKKYLDKSKYNWENDERHLKVDKDGIMTIPRNRCFHCGRLVENFAWWAAFCRECHTAMSISVDGPEYDFSDTNNPKQHLAVRDSQIPIDFEIEDAWIRGKQKSNFVTGTGIPIRTEEKEEGNKE